MSPDLQGEVVLMSNWRWVSQVAFIKHIMPSAELSDVSSAPHFVIDVALSLSSAIFAQSEVFGAPRTLYVLKKGLAIARSGGWIKIASTGSVWGEDFVLSDIRLRDPEARLALTYIEAFFLESETFLQIVNRHRLSDPELGKQVRRFTTRLSARRAILFEARWRRFQNVGDAQLPPKKSKSYPSSAAPIIVSSGTALEPSRWRAQKAVQKEFVDHNDAGWELNNIQDEVFGCLTPSAQPDFTSSTTPHDIAL